MAKYKIANVILNVSANYDRLPAPLTVSATYPKGFCVTGPIHPSHILKMRPPDL
jgi:hypothetical protein